MVVCSHCNAKVASGKFCSECGARLTPLTFKGVNLSFLRTKNFKIAILALSILIAFAVAVWFYSTSSVLSTYNSKLALHSAQVQELNSLFTNYTTIPSAHSGWNDKIAAGDQYLTKTKKVEQETADLVVFIQGNSAILQQRAVDPIAVINSLQRDNSSITVNSKLVSQQLRELNFTISTCNRLITQFNSIKSNYNANVALWNQFGDCSGKSFEEAPLCRYNASITLDELKTSIEKILLFVDTNPTSLQKCDFNSATEKATFTSELAKVQQQQLNLPPVRLNRVIGLGVAPLPSWADQSYSAILPEAFSYWQQRVNASFQIVPQASIQLEWVKEFGTQALGHVVNTNFVQIGLGDSNCLNEWKPYTYETVKQITTHELGHVIGFDHSPDPTNVMYATSKIRYAYDFNKQQILAPRYILFIPFCTQEAQSTYTFEVASDRAITAGIVASQAAYEQFTSTGNLTSAEGCQKYDSISSFTTSCVVPKGGGLLIANPSNTASASVTIKMRES